MILYIANPSAAPIRDHMNTGRLGCMLRPGQGNRAPAGALVAIDNGCGPGKDGHAGTGYPGDAAYWRFLTAAATELGHDPYTADSNFCDPDLYRCLFAVAPDVLADAKATLARSHDWLFPIREYTGLPVALVAQNGLEHLPVPWDEIDVLFLGGSAECTTCAYIRPPEEARTRTRCPSCGRHLAEWKLSRAAWALTAEAKARGLWVHMGRVNSLRRLRCAERMGCDSADGTYMTRAPDRNLARALGWLDALDVEDLQGDLWTA